MFELVSITINKWLERLWTLRIYPNLVKENIEENKIKQREIML